MKTLSFYRRDGSWYTDLPAYIASGGSEADCLMVAGADTWLDMLSEGADRVTLRLSLEDELPEKIELLDTDSGGGTYIARTYAGKIFNHQLWLCPVTLLSSAIIPNVFTTRKYDSPFMLK